MFGTTQKVEAAVSATREEYRSKARLYFAKQVKYMNGSGALAWLRGGLELAQEAGILTAQEIEYFDTQGKEKYEANLKAIREEKDRVLAQRKAERAAKAKVEKEKLK